MENLIKTAQETEEEHDKLKDEVVALQETIKSLETASSNKAGYSTE